MTNDNKIMPNQMEQGEKDMLDAATLKLSELEEIINTAGVKKREIDENAQLINSLKNDLETKRVEIEGYVGQIKTQIDLISKSQIASDETKNKISELKGASEVELKNITSIKNQLTQTEQSIGNLVLELNNQKTKIESSVKEVSQKIISIDDSFKKIGEIKTASEAAWASIGDHLNQSNEKQKQIGAIVSSVTKQNTELQTKFSEVNVKVNEVNTRNDEIRARYNEIIDTHKKLITDEKDAQSKVVKKSISTEISELFSHSKENFEEMRNYFEEQKKNFSDLYANLNGKILALLPSAGAAGLASTYFEAKGRYSFVGEQCENSGKWSWVKKIMPYIFKNVSTTWVYYGIFILPLLVLAYLNRNLLDSALTWPVIATRIVVGLPFFIVSYFGFSSINLNRKLYEEYNHKQRVMQLYHSFEKEVSSLDDNDLKLKLLNIMLDVVSDKPSDEIDKYDKHFVEKITSKITEEVLKKVPSLS